MRVAYPWTAVVGQDALKHALLLCAIDPEIGGVLVQGPRGVAKTTLARALAELCPGSFVELPLGASDERVTGTLDLGAALRDGQVSFSPGLLARAHEGVLYVDEVNLLPDALVDLLLDASASGQNVVERDGISHVHPARFVLIGTMNPEEGELRPQLTDRFGLSVRASAEITPRERAEIVARRLSFDRDPAAFTAEYAEAQRAVVERCRRAREIVGSIALSGSGLEAVTDRCYRAGVEGVRADLAMLRAARAHAAWHGRSEIATADVDAVAELALAHRRSEAPSPRPPRGGSSGGSQGGARGPGAAGEDSGEGTSKSGPSNQRNGGDGGGALAPVPVRPAQAVTLPTWLTEARGVRAEMRRRGAVCISGRRGERAREQERGQASIDWFGTLSRTPKPQPRDLRYRERRAPSAMLWVLAIDCSASMLRGGALSAAKSVALAFEARATRAGAHVALLSFQGASAELAVNTGARAGTRSRALKELGGGGGTPLRAAVREALSLCESPRFSARSIDKRIVLLTDGRSEERVSDLASGRRDVSFIVVDCERGPVRLDRARALSAALNGQLVHVDSLR